MIFLSILFWVFLAAYVIHLLDETLMNGGFVRWIQDNYWPDYHMSMFFWFNTGAVLLIVISNLLSDSLQGHWVILPIIWVAGFVTHVLTVHLYWTIRLRNYSPGLVSSTLYMVIFYLLIKYGLGGHLVTATDFAIGTLLGIVTVGAFLTVGPTWLFPKLVRPRHPLQG
jgi:hypothetical protein